MIGLDGSPQERAKQELAWWLRYAIGSWACSNADAANRLGVDVTTFNQILSGDLGSFDVSALMTLADKAELNVVLRVLPR